MLVNTNLQQQYIIYEIHISTVSTIVILQKVNSGNSVVQVILALGKLHLDKSEEKPAAPFIKQNNNSILVLNVDLVRGGPKHKQKFYITFQSSFINQIRWKSLHSTIEELRNLNLSLCTLLCIFFVNLITS